VARLAWHLGASAQWGVSSERRRKDILRLRFATLTRKVSPAVGREIATLNPLSRTPLPESRALRAFRRSVCGPRFGSEFERWYAHEVDHAPLRAFVADVPTDETLPAMHRGVSLPDTGRPPAILTLSRTAQRALLRDALAEIAAKLVDDTVAPADRRLQQAADQSRAESPTAAAKDILAGLLRLSMGALTELGRGR